MKVKKLKNKNLTNSKRPFDPQGSYTGKKQSKYDEVVQDADDL